MRKRSQQDSFHTNPVALKNKPKQQIQVDKVSQKTPNQVRSRSASLTLGKEVFETRKIFKDSKEHKIK